MNRRKIFFSWLPWENDVAKKFLIDILYVYSLAWITQSFWIVFFFPDLKIFVSLKNFWVYKHRKLKFSNLISITSVNIFKYLPFWVYSVFWCVLPCMVFCSLLFFLHEVNKNNFMSLNIILLYQFFNVISDTPE